MKPKTEPSFFYDISSNAKARRSLKTLRQQGFGISPNTKQDCNDYAHHVLGSKRYAPWLYVFASVQGQFKEGWFPHNYYRRYIATRRKGAYGDVSAFGGISPQLFASEAFPNLGYYQ